MIGLLTVAGIAFLALRKKRGVSGIGNSKCAVSGLKYYFVTNFIGNAKYVVNYTDGKKRHEDGSTFFDIAIFSNKKALNAFVKSLESDGYIKA